MLGCLNLLNVANMKSIRIIAAIATGLVFSVLVGCSKEESSPSNSSTNNSTDARDLSVGNYTATYISTIGGETDSGATTFSILKGANNTINISEDGILIASGAIVTTGSNFKASIPAQTLVIYDEDSSSFSANIVGNGNEHITFDATTKRLTYSYKVSDFGMGDVLFTSTGIKQ